MSDMSILVFYAVISAIWAVWAYISLSRSNRDKAANWWLRIVTGIVLFGLAGVLWELLSRVRL